MTATQTMFAFEAFEDTETPITNTKSTVTYCTVKFQIGWLPGALGFTEQAKAALAADLGIAKNVIRGSYAILGASRDPLIQEGAALKRLLTTIRNTYTIPEYTLVSSAAQQDNLKAEKVAGSYLIEAVRIDEFLQRFNEVREQYLAWGKRVADPENYERLKAADQVALGKDWEIVSHKYPTAAQMADSITCDIPRIEPFDATFTLADVAPETSRMLREQAEARLNASVEGATAELVSEFKTMVEAVARNCGKRVRLLPPENHARADLRQAEVQQILRHADAPEDIPADKLLVTVQRCADRDGKLVQHGKSEEILLTEQEYRDMRPFETDEHRILAQSSFDNLMWLANKINDIRKMLGSSQEAQDLTELAADVCDVLGELGNSAAEITRNIKLSSYTRMKVKETFSGFLDRITTQGLETRAQAKPLARKLRIRSDA